MHVYITGCFFSFIIRDSCDSSLMSEASVWTRHALSKSGEWNKAGFHRVYLLGSWILSHKLNHCLISFILSFVFFGKSGNGSAEINSELSINGSQFVLKPVSFHLSKGSSSSLMWFFYEVHEIIKMLQEDACLGWPMKHHQYVAALPQTRNIIATL